MKKMNSMLLFVFTLLMACGGSNLPIDGNHKPGVEVKWEISPTTTTFSSTGETKSIIVKANGDWTVSSNQSWVTMSPNKGGNGEMIVKITALANIQEAVRNTELLFVSGKYSYKYTVNQEAGKPINYVPDGYNLKWAEEFNDARLTGGKPSLPNTTKWWYENLAKGSVNNELQTYVSGVKGTDTVAAIYDGTLKIMAKKIGGEVYSARINTIESWTYGYFEARLRMPSGKGTWPAFWMMPKNFNKWPDDGEIDIMEYVGYDPNVVHASIHTKAYNHTIGTQKTAQKRIENAETQFHIYAVEWTEDYIKGFVDGVEYFKFDNDKTNNKSTWPFNAPFYLKLNLAWGGDWGGAQGIDESKLPATYEIDYVRVYQK
ncbi:MAG: family 16 glycosylhydrolase [Dysgonamonadaceae bacterium]|nr:family 16 glycosylhydrolase [Dysgonamonadaceae bacterium]